MATAIRVWFNFYHSLSILYKHHDKECPITKFAQFSKCSFGEIVSQRLTASPYIWN